MRKIAILILIMLQLRAVEAVTTSGAGFDYVHPNKNLGVGILNPQYKLTVNGTTFTKGFRMQTGATNGYVLTSNGSGAAAWRSLSSLGANNAAGSNTWFQFNDNGIFGGNGALSLLTASKTLVVAADAPLDINSTNVSIADTNMSLDGASTTFTQTTGAITMQPASGSNLNVTLATTGDFVVNTNQLYVDTSATNVGIGTSTPAEKLQVAGTVQSTGLKMTTGAANNYILTSDALGLSTWTNPNSIIIGTSLNSNNLDTLDSTQFLRSDTSDQFTSGTLTTLNGTTLKVNGDFSLREKSAPTASSGFGKLFVNAASSNLFFLDDSGASYDLLSALSGSAPAAGSNTQFQFNDAGILGGNGALTFTKASKTLTVDATAPLDINSTALSIADSNIVFDGASTTFAQSNSGFAFDLNGSGDFVVEDSRLIADSNGNVGINTNNPQARLDIRDGGGANERGLQLTQSSNDISSAIFSMKKSRGTPGAPSIVSNGDTISYLNFRPFNGDGFMWTAGLGARVRGTVTGTSIPTDLFFSTSGGGDDYNPFFSNTVRMLIDSTGNIGVGTTIPNEKLTINGSAPIVSIREGSSPASTANFGKLFVSSINSQLYFRDDAGVNYNLTNGSNPTVPGGLNTYFQYNNGGSFGGSDALSFVKGTKTLAVASDAPLDINSTTVSIADTNISFDSPSGVTFTPTAGQNLNVALSTTGDFAVNTNQLYVDTSATNVGVGTTSPIEKLQVAGTVQATGLKMTTGAANNAIFVSDATGLGVWTNPTAITVGNASNLDTLDSTQFLRSDTSDQFTSGTLTTATGTTFKVNGDFALIERTAPALAAGFGKLFVNSTSSNLMFLDDAGISYDLLASLSGSTIAGGSNSQFQFNDAGILAGNGALTFTKASKTLTVDATAPLDINSTTVSIADTNISFDSPSGVTFTPTAGQSLNIDVSGTGDFAVNGDTLYVDSSARNLGIGTQSPAMLLHAYHLTNSALGIFESGGSGSYIQTKDNTSNAFFGNTGNLAIIGFHAPGDPRNLNITNLGAVGIGTTVPNTALTINGSNIALSMREGTAPGATTNYGKLFVSSANSQLYFVDDAGVNYNLTNGSNPTVPGGLNTYFQYNNGGSFGGSDALSFVKGTKTLAVASDAPLDINSTTVSIADTNISFDSPSGVTFTPTAGQNLNIDVSGSGDFAVNGDTLYVDSSSRNVGIGTINPNTLFTVNGTSAALSLRRSTTLPSDTSKFGKIYVSNADGELYFNSDDSAAVRLTNNGSIAELEKGGYYDNLLQYHLNSTPVNGIKMVTNIPFTNQTQMPTIIIEGYNYGRASTIGLILNWYLYNALDTANPDVISCSVSSFGGYAPEIKIARESGKVVIFMNNRDYYNRFHVRAYAKGLMETKEWFEGWTARDEALTGDKIVTLPYRNQVGSLTINGETALRETAAPFATANYGKLFVSSTSSNLMFLDDSGASYDLLASLSGSTIAGGSNSQFQFNDAGILAGNGALTFTKASKTLTVDATAPLDINSTNVSIADTNIAFDGASTTFTGTGAMTITPGSGTNLNVSLSTTGDFAVNTNQLYVDTSATNVGVGTTTPLEKLQVAGTVQSTGIKMTTSPSTDFVLASDASGVGSWRNVSTLLGNGAQFIDELGDAISNKVDSVFIGNGAGLANSGSTASTAVGINSLRRNKSTGLNNSAFGMNSLLQNTNGDNNAAFGGGALMMNENGSNNTAIGLASAYFSRNGLYNSSLGALSLLNNIEGSYNVALGGYALSGLSSGNGNIAIGYQAGDNITSGSSNIIVGNDVDAPSATGSNQLNIANTIYGDIASQNIGIGVNSTFSKLALNGNLAIRETVAPTATANYGKLFVNSTTSNLMFMDDAGASFDLLSSFSSSTIAGGSNSQFQFNDAGILAGNGALTFTKATKTLSIPTDAPLDINSTTVSIADTDISFDGASTTFTGTGAMTITPGAGTNLNVSLATTGDFAVNTNQLYVDTSATNTGFGMTAPNEKITIEGRASFRETTRPTATANYGKLYVNGATSNLMFLDDAGVQHDLNRFGAQFIDELIDGKSFTDNVYLGSGTGASDSASTSNTGVGIEALNSIDGGNALTAFGYRAMYSTDAGDYNTGIGALSLFHSNGIDNTAVGYNSAYNNISGEGNSAFGSQSLVNNIFGHNNTAIGFESIGSLSSGSNNTGVGYGTMASVGSISRNNTALGSGAGPNSGGPHVSHNGIYLGFYAGNNITTGSNNIIIGYDVDAPSATANNQLNIGNSIYGNLANRNIGIGANFTNERLTVNGNLSLREGAAPTASANFGKLFVSSTTSNLVFMDDAGATFDLLSSFSSATNAGGSNSQFQFNDSGVLAGNGALTFTKATKTLTVDATAPLDINSTNVSIADTNIAFDGASTTFTGTGAMTITPGSGTNLNVSLATTGDFAVNTNQLYVDTSATNTGFGMTAPNEKITVEGRASLRETTRPSLTANYGKLYVNGTTSNLMFMDDTGTEYDITTSGGIPGGSNTWFQFNDGGTFAGNGALAFTKASRTLTVAANAPLDINSTSLSIADDNISFDSASGVTFTPAVGQNLNIALSTTGDFAVNTNQLYVDTSATNTGFGMTAPNEKVTIEGNLSLREGSAPTLTANYGKLFVNSTTSNLVFMDDAGATFDLLSSFSSATNAGGSNSQFQFNDSGVLAGNGALIFTKATKTLTVDATAPLDINSTNVSIADTNIAFDGASTTFTGTGAMTITPGSGTNLNVSLATTGDFAVNTNQLYVDTSTTNVGISITAPNAELHINGASAAAKTLIVEAAPSQTANLTEWQNSTGTALSVVTSAGNVGINQTTASYPLSVTGNTDMSALGPIYARSSGGANIGTALSLDATDNAGGKRWSFISTGAVAGPGAGSFAVYNSTDSRYEWLTLSSGRTQFGVNMLTDLGARVAVQPESASTRGLVVRAAASQTANLSEWQSNGTVVRSLIDNGGRMAINRATRRAGSVLDVNGTIFTTGLLVNGTNPTFSIREGTAPSATANFGKVFVNSANSRLYFQDDAGVNYNLTNGATAVTPGGSNTWFQFNDGGSLGGNGALTFTKATRTLAVAANAPLDINSTTVSIADTDITFDGASTTFTGTGAMTITPGSGTNLNVSLATTGDFAVNTNQLYVDTSATNTGFGMTAPNEKITVEGRASLRETTRPTLTANYGKLYVNGTTSNLMFLDDAGAQFDLLGGSGGGGATKIDDLSDAISDRNTQIYVGNGAGASAGTDYNSAFGINVLNLGTASTYNTAIGYQSMSSATSSDYNVAVGAATMRGIFSDFNVAVGYAAMNGNLSSAFRNTAVGYKAGTGMTLGDNNILIGYQAGDLITSGSNNIIIGYDIDPPANTTSNFINIGNAIFGDSSTTNVGIGVVSPVSKLAVNGDVGFKETTTQTASANFGEVYVNSSDSELYFDADDQSPVRITNNGSLATSGGGTPGGSNTQFQFNNSGTFAGNGSLTYTTATRTIAIAANAPLDINSTTVSIADPNIDFDSASGVTFTPTAGQNLNVALSTTGDFVVNTNQLYVDTSVANVGIGDVTPMAKLDVNGTLALKMSTITNITAGGGITVTRTIMKVQGSGGAVDITANPQIADAAADGTMLILKGASDTNTLKLDDGTGLDLTDGISFTLGLGDTITLVYDIVDDVWVEISRSNK